MKESTFKKVILAVVSIALVLTMAHLIYIIQAYQQCSIIYFIAKELW